MATSDYHRALNDWHLELAMLRDLVNELLWQMEGEGWMKSAGHIAGLRFSHLVETCPFPPQALDHENLP